MNILQNDKYEREIECDLAMFDTERKFKCFLCEDTKRAYGRPCPCCQSIKEHY